MKIKLVRPGGFFGSASHLIIDSDKIDNIKGDDDGSVVTMANGDEYTVKESPEQIEKLYQVKPAATVKAKDKEETEP